MPYPLPEEGPPYTTGLRWFLVAVPDDPAFVQAALGAYTELASYWLWGKEANEAGRQEAAKTWQVAVDATLEALQMGFPETLLGYIDGVETLLESLLAASCCNTESPIADLMTDDWEAGNDVPQNIVDAGYASSTSDQAGMDDYKCMIAHVAARDLIIKMDRFTDLAEASGAIPGAVGIVAGTLLVVFGLPALAGVLTAMTIGILQVAGVAAGLYAFFATIGKAGMAALTNDLEGLEDDIACAIYSADGNVAAGAAVQALLENEVGAAAATALTPVIAGVIDALYAGRYDQTNTAQALADAGFTLGQHDCGSCQGDYMVELTHTGNQNLFYAYGSNPVTFTFPDVAANRYLDGTWYQYGGTLRMYKWDGDSWNRVQFQWTSHTLSPVPNNETSGYGVRGFQNEGDTSPFFQYDGSTPTLPTNVQGGLAKLALIDSSQTQGNASFTGTVTLTSLT